MTRQQEVEINKLLNRQEKLFNAQAHEPDEKIKKAIQVVIDLYFDGIYCTCLFWNLDNTLYD